jgi:hypothetical protein
MTEEEWTVCQRPWPLLSLLQSRGSASQRKLRLFSVACCVYNSDLFADARLMRGLSVAEKVADCCAAERECTEAKSVVLDVFEGELDVPQPDGGCGSDPILFLLNRQAYTIGDAARCVDQLEYAAEYTARNSFDGLVEELRYEHCALLREIFGNPFRPFTFDPTWRTSDVMLLASGVYAERAFDRMPILADALQDAGCDADALLNHLRDPHAAHVRGCWALDLVLGKE